MKTIGIISSPLQFTNFAEYVYQKKLDNYNLIVLYYSKLEITQINKLNSIYNIKIYKKVRGFPVLQYIWLLSFGLKIKSCDKILIGNFFSESTKIAIFSPNFVHSSIKAIFIALYVFSITLAVSDSVGDDNLVNGKSFMLIIDFIEVICTPTV